MKKPFYKRWWFILIVALAVIYGLSTLTLLSDDEELAEEPKTTVAEKPKEVKEDTVDKKVKNAIIDAIGEKNNLKKSTIEEITFEADEKLVVITLNADQSLTNKMTKEAMWLNSKKVFEGIKDIDGVEYYTFQWYYPLVDTYGNEEDGLVMSFDVTKDELQKINYDNFLMDNVPKVVMNYFEHPGFSE